MRRVRRLDMGGVGLGFQGVQNLNWRLRGVSIQIGGFACSVQVHKRAIWGWHESLAYEVRQKL